MAYKDKDKQREAVKLATQRYRAKKADSALSGQNQGLRNARGLIVVDDIGDTHPVIPSGVIPEDVKSVIPEDITVEKMIQCVADEGGEYSHKTVAGKVKDAHRTEPVRPQSYNPMMVGYVPPAGKE